uniref:Uncharacterized protein n=1 Tax=Steinernema glaseri TaxID=37863 RepID=A0A1I7YXF0_9BILA
MCGFDMERRKKFIRRKAKTFPPRSVQSLSTSLDTLQSLDDSCPMFPFAYGCPTSYGKSILALPPLIFPDIIATLEYPHNDPDRRFSHFATTRAHFRVISP